MYHPCKLGFLDEGNTQKMWLPPKCGVIKIHSFQLVDNLLILIPTVLVLSKYKQNGFHIFFGPRLLSVSQFVSYKRSLVWPSHQLSGSRFFSEQFLPTKQRHVWGIMDSTNSTAGEAGASAASPGADGTRRGVKGGHGGFGRRIFSVTNTAVLD